MSIPLYREELLDHYRYPRNNRVLEDAHVSVEVLNPSCGDHIMLQLCIENERVVRIGFQGKGCVISQSAASLLSERVLLSSRVECEALTKEAVLDLIGISLGPTRLRCALLALEALHSALTEHKN